MINKWILCRGREKLLLQNEMASFWKAADINLVTDRSLKGKLEYGKDLISIPLNSQMVVSKKSLMG
jgi:hypothetical protein